MDMDDDYDSAQPTDDEVPSEDSNAGTTSTEEEAEFNEDDDSMVGPYAPMRALVTIDKGKAGAMVVDTTIDGSELVIDHISFYRDAKLATEATAEAEYKRRGLYSGPDYAMLDDDLKSALVRYLEERGIDENLFLSIPQYLQQKEQREYVKWLEHVKKFVDA